jgi:hypothetical protein
VDESPTFQQVYKLADDYFNTFYFIFLFFRFSHQLNRKFYLISISKPRFNKKIKNEKKRSIERDI